MTTTTTTTDTQPRPPHILGSVLADETRLRPANDDGKQEGKEGGGGLGDTPQSLGLPHLLIERADLRRRQ